jgi:hypothetical protein
MILKSIKIKLYRRTKMKNFNQPSSTKLFLLIVKNVQLYTIRIIFINHTAIDKKLYLESETD